MIVRYKFNEIYIRKPYFEYSFNFEHIFEYRKVKKYIEENRLKNDKLVNFLIYYILQKIVYNKTVI